MGENLEEGEGGMITNILLGLILLALVSIGFMIFVMGRILDERTKK